MASDPTTAPRTTRLAAIGLLVTLAGILGYFLVVYRVGAWLPRVRNDALVIWAIVAVGLVLLVRAVARAPRGRRVVPGVLLGMGGILTGAFALLLYGFTAVPPATGPAIGRPAPAFALLDQTGKTVRLEDFRGTPLLLVFYRGHW
jgi:uncharacterized membrane protein (UPF0136 family)